MDTKNPRDISLTKFLQGHGGAALQGQKRPSKNVALAQFNMRTYLFFIFGSVEYIFYVMNVYRYTQYGLMRNAAFLPVLNVS